jgi:hypothetical protein
VNPGSFTFNAVMSNGGFPSRGFSGAYSVSQKPLAHLESVTGGATQIHTPSPCIGTGCLWGSEARDLSPQDQFSHAHKGENQCATYLKSLLFKSQPRRKGRMGHWVKSLLNPNVSLPRTSKAQSSKLFKVMQILTPTMLRSTVALSFSPEDGPEKGRRRTQRHGSPFESLREQGHGTKTSLGHKRFGEWPDGDCLDYKQHRIQTNGTPRPLARVPAREGGLFQFILKGFDSGFKACIGWLYTCKYIRDIFRGQITQQFPQINGIFLFPSKHGLAGNTNKFGHFGIIGQFKRFLKPGNHTFRKKITFCLVLVDFCHGMGYIEVRG